MPLLKGNFFFKLEQTLFVFSDGHLPAQVVFGRPFVKRFALSYRTVVCPVCLSVTLVYCGQTAGWIKMPLGTDVDLGQGRIVLDGDPAPP